ncbi:hypothetical protein K502DRAFT_326829 [Neoconidiobolus thromboides FSU 785]|nr:hypothetical protein K502DRAFT_326829 [Neoconidiobolus thromboides FSU 785]
MNQYIKIKESIISIIDLFENPNSSSHLIVSIEFNDKLDSIYNNIQHFNIEDNENQPNLNDIENLGVDLWNATTKYKNNKILSLESFNNLALTNGDSRRVSYELIKLGKYHDKKYLSELCYKISLEYLNSNDLKLAEDYLNELNNLNGSSLDRNVQNEDAIKQAMLKIKLFIVYETKQVNAMPNINQFSARHTK